jgi:hypothetical protein
MNQRRGKLNFADPGHEPENQVSRLCQRVRTWADAMRRGGTGEFEVHWIRSATPGAAPTGPECAEILEGLIRSYDEIEGLAVLVRRRSRQRGRIYRSSGKEAKVEPTLLEVVSSSGRDPGLEPRQTSLIHKLFSERKKLGD